jgi:sterol desaturase/sphingolipid hydroxylase (fatty acid hydroxylase superfamily)
MDVLQYLSPFITNLVKYFIFVGVPFLIFYKLYPNTFSKGKIQSRWAKKKDFIREILHSIQMIFISTVLVVAILKSPLKDYTLFYNTKSDYSIWWVPISVLLALIVHDSYFYWMHRTIHHPRLYKKVHFLHHKSINPSPWASYSFHFIEAVFESMFIVILLFFIPMSKISLLLFGLCAFSINVYGHLGYEIAPKWFRNSFLFEFINSSVYHNMHHSKFIGNYGLYFRFWDRLMKTEHPDYIKEYDKIQKIRFHLKED